MEGQGPPKTTVELQTSESGDERPDGKNSREGARHGDGELLDTLIQQFIQTVFVKIFFLKKNLEFKIKFFLRKPLSSLPRA